MSAQIIRQQLRQARRAQKITYRDLAKRLNVSASHLCDIEQGKRQPSQELADKLKLVFPEVAVEKLILLPCAERIAELEAEIQRLKDANRWIPVSERLPTKTGHYWTTKKYKNVEVMVGQNLFISDYNEFSTQSEVLAWREIQDFWNEPYQEEK